MSGIENMGAVQPETVRAMDEMTLLLRELEAKASEPRPEVLPNALPISGIIRREGLFQPRAESAQHIWKLRQGYKRDGGLTPLTVFQAGASVYLVDGHHRWTAYSHEKVTAPIPVEYFEGTAKEAVLEAGRANSPAKLPMTTDEKMDYAWRLVRSRLFSKAQEIRASGTSNGSVSEMRATLKVLGEDAGAYETWKAALRAGRPSSGPMTEEEQEAWKERMADRHAATLHKHFLNKLVMQPEIAAMALERHFGHHLGLLVEALTDIVGETIVDVEPDEDSDF